MLLYWYKLLPIYVRTLSRAKRKAFGGSDYPQEDECWKLMTEQISITKQPPGVATSLPDFGARRQRRLATESPQAGAEIGYD